MGKPIGVLGCSGTVGKNVTEKLLRNGYAVLGGQRSGNCPFLTRTEFQFCRMDMENPVQLLAFCQACSVVVNCTAPFSCYGAKVARAAGVSGAIYIDGADFLLQEKELPPEGTYVVGSGYVPGIAEYLAAQIARTELDIPEQIILYQGGTELCSESAFVDIVMNGTASGYADACYAEKICPLHGNFKAFHQLPDFPHPVLLKPYLTRSLLEMRERVGWKRMCWYNAYENMQFLQMLFQAYRCMKTDRTHAEENIRKTMQKYAPQISKTGVYSVLGMELQGVQNGRKKWIRSGLFLTDSSRLCGYAMAETAISVLENPPEPGVHPADALLREDYLERLRGELNKSEYFYIREIDEKDAMPFAH